MKNITEQSRPKWNELNLNPPPLFYGSSSGVFRIYPGTPYNCSTFDPRLRPWFIAVTGPKSIVIILDTSLSTGKNNRINDLKEAVKLVINTLSLSDYVSLITCSDVEQLRLTSKFVKATNDNKKDLLDRLDSITDETVRGGDNFNLCFNEAFDIMDQNEELTAGSQKAIMFFTDGTKTNSESSREDSLIESINEHVLNYTRNNMKPPVFFTYSFSGTDSELPKKIACETNGFWRGIDIEYKFETMSTYFKYFSLGLSDSQNENFTARVEPYDFASDQALGTTVSAPAYDRSVDPPVLRGVVAMDITIAALKKASGVHDESVIFELIQELVDRSVPKDSNIQLDNCTLESLRYHDDKYNATCSNLCTNITIFGVKECTMSPTLSLP
jgi:hypothetical protein